MKFISDWFGQFYYNVIYVNKNELPQLVKDFNRTLSIKTVRNVDDIIIRIKCFNYNVVQALEKLEKKESKNLKKLNQELVQD